MLLPGCHAFSRGMPSTWIAALLTCLIFSVSGGACLPAAGVLIQLSMAASMIRFIVLHKVFKSTPELFPECIVGVSGAVIFQVVPVFLQERYILIVFLVFAVYVNSKGHYITNASFGINSYIFQKDISFPR